jgi:hypothetical protein
VGIDDNATSTAITIDASENVALVGDALLGSLTGFSGGTGALTIADSASNPTISIRGPDAGTANIYFGDTTDWTQGAISYDFSTDAMRFYTSNINERMRITSAGSVLVGKTVGDGTAGSTVGIELDANGGLEATRSGNNAGMFSRRGSNGNCVLFRRDATSVGAITVTTTGTTYNTTSDLRLKTDIKPISNSTEKLMAMNPVTHGWKANPEADTVHGFIAQEMIEIIPEAVSGEPEGEEMMSMDYGRITPVIVAALQEANKKIAEIETRLNELETK